MVDYVIHVYTGNSQITRAVPLATPAKLFKIVK